MSGMDIGEGGRRLEGPNDVKEELPAYTARGAEGLPGYADVVPNASGIDVELGRMNRAPSQTV